MLQLGGSLGVAGGLFATLTTGGVAPAIALGLGSVVYGVSTLREWGTTKSLSPIPYSDLNLLDVFEGHRTGVKKQRQRVTAYQHLTDEEKAAYVLCTVLEPVTLKMVEGREPDEIQVVFTHMKETLIRSYGEVIHPDGTAYRLLEDPHAVVDYVFGGPRGFCDDYRNALPTDLGVAVEVDSLPERPIKQLSPAAHLNDAPLSDYLSELDQVASPLEEDDDLIQGILDNSVSLISEEDPWGASEKTAARDWQSVFQRIVNQAEFPSIFIYGRQGTGKTTLVNYLLSLIKNEKIVLDPHYKYGSWQGCEVIGKGMKYEEIDEFIEECLDDIQSRYALYATTPNYQPKIVTVVCEELTNWAEHIKKGKKFTKASLSDFRKAGYQCINVAHGETNTARGGASGTRAMRDEGEVHIKLLGKGRARISIPEEVPFELIYPNLENYISGETQ